MSKAENLKNAIRAAVAEGRVTLDALYEQQDIDPTREDASLDEFLSLFPGDHWTTVAQLKECMEQVGIRDHDHGADVQTQDFLHDQLQARKKAVLGNRD